MTQKVIIIGAPRSGTNMLRDVLTQVPGFATWPCDEINYVWRHGNRGCETDELPADVARRRVVDFIRGKFDSIAHRYSAQTVVEKTCANSLRVPFVHSVVPEAKFVFIRRDGIDAAASAMHRWHAPMDVGYLARKARYVPITDLPFYVGRFAVSRAKRLTGAQSTDTWWGPRFEGMRQAQREHPLDVVCALQWRRCVELAADALSRLPEGDVHELCYEDFVAKPQLALGEILEFLGSSFQVRESMVSGVSEGSVGKGRAKLGAERSAVLTEFVRPTMERFGYV